MDYVVGQQTVSDITLLKAPPHGSRNGPTLPYLRVARPEVVVISVGENMWLLAVRGG